MHKSSSSLCKRLHNIVILISPQQRMVAIPSISGQFLNAAIELPMDAKCQLIDTKHSVNSIIIKELS